MSRRGSLSLQDEGKFDPRSIPLKSWSDYVRIFFYRMGRHPDKQLGERTLGQGV
jgi:hypothetical protein